MAHTRAFKADLEDALTLASRSRSCRRSLPPFVIVQTLAELGAGDPIERLALVQPAGESGDDVRRDGFTTRSVRLCASAERRDEDEDAAATLAARLDETDVEGAPVGERRVRDRPGRSGRRTHRIEWTIRSTWIDIDCRECRAAGTRNRTVRRGKKAAGRLLDGRTWDERPARVSGRLL